jgi:hypothetical protein
MTKYRDSSAFSRRDFLKLVGVGAGAAFWNGCAPQAALPATVQGPTSQPTETPDPRKLCFVLWDHQLAQYDFKPRRPNIPLPQTCPLASGARNPLTPEWQAYWRGILQLCNPGMSAAQFEPAWESLINPTRAFTNHSAPLAGNFVLQSLTCGGATHEMVTGIPEGKYMRIYTLNSKKSPPPIPAKPEEIDITRHFFATTGSSVRLADGSYAVYGFPQFEDCIVPLVSREDTDLIALDRIKVVTNIQRPYNT